MAEARPARRKPASVQEQGARQHVFTPIAQRVLNRKITAHGHYVAVLIAFGVRLRCVLLTFVLGGAAGIVGASGDPEASMAIPIIGLTGAALVSVLVVLSLPSLVIGVGLINMRPWARIGGMVLSVMSLIMIPFGTIIGAYGLWVLFSKDTERLFAGPALPQQP